MNKRVALTRHLVYVLFLVTVLPCEAGRARKVPPSQVKVTVTNSPKKDALLHWAITNESNLGVFVYNFYLWGPAYQVERNGDRVILNTTPVKEMGGCGLDRFPPILLLIVAPHKTIEGDFSDTELRDVAGKLASMRIAVGADPFSVVEQAKRFYNDKECRHTPYDAIVQWGTILESNTVRISGSGGGPSGATGSQKHSGMGHTPTTRSNAGMTQ